MMGMKVRIVPNDKRCRSECFIDLGKTSVSTQSPSQRGGLALSRIPSSNGVIVAILAEAENKRRGARPEKTRGSICEENQEVR